MKREYEVRWYEHNLTQEKSKRFFTELAALLYAWYIEFKHGVITIIYSHD